MVPFGQTRRRFDGWNFGKNHGGEMARMPLGPSTIVPRTSAAVGPAMRMIGFSPDSAHARTVSAPVCVLPNPRPARMSHVAQSPGGRRWFGRAQSSQRRGSRAALAE
jgi:hypothetical protein